MPRPVQDFIVDEFGRIWIGDDDGNPYSGPYDTLEDATAALDLLEADDGGVVGREREPHG